jgi:hypothetical protein
MLKFATVSLALFVGQAAHAAGCKLETISAPLQASIGGDNPCGQLIKEKLCAPAGKTIVSSAVTDVGVSKNLETRNETDKVVSNCIEAKVRVWSRIVFGPPIWQYCREGNYAGRVELTYCR